MAGHLSTSEPPDEHYSDLLFSYSIAYDIQVSSVFLVDCQKKKKQSGFSSTGELKGPVLFPGEIDITSVPCRVYRRAVNERLKNAGARARDAQGQGVPNAKLGVGGPRMPSPRGSNPLPLPITTC